MYLTLFFSLLQKCHLTNSVALSDQTQPFIPSALPHQRNASFPLKALVEPSGTFTTCRGSPWPAQLGQHLGLAFRPPLPRAQGSGKPPFYISARARGRPFLGEPAWPITSHHILGNVTPAFGTPLSHHSCGRASTFWTSASPPLGHLFRPVSLVEPSPHLPTSSLQ